MAETRYDDGFPKRRDSSGGSERYRAECLQVSQGPISSIKAAFKRTSLRALSQADCSSERRRPEITILSVEPLTAPSWYAGSARQFSSSAFSTQTIWSEPGLTTSQVPPSYEQVIKEKRQEQATTPSPGHTTTISTQTHSVQQNAIAPETCASSQLNYHLSEVKQPKKPPRPSLPDRHLLQENTGSPASTPNTHKSAEVAPTLRPVPQPRTKVKPLRPASQVNIQTHNPLQDGLDDIAAIPVESSHSDQYLQQILDVFSSQNQTESTNPVNTLGEEGKQTKGDDSENMTSLHNDRNIRSRIQAFENQSSTDNNETSVPFPRPRKITAKPPVLAPKPSIAPRPSAKKHTEERLLDFESHLYEEVLPPAAPKPQLLQKLSIESSGESKAQDSFKTALIPPLRSSLVNVKDEVEFKAPFPPLKPSKVQLNFNNHNSTALQHDVTYSANKQSNDYWDASVNQSTTKPPQVGFSYIGPNPQGVTRRPTVIRVPSKTDQTSEDTAEFAPPLPVQKAVGGPPTPAKPSCKDPFSFSSDVSLPPRPSAGKVLPSRPPSAKAGPGRPPPPRKDNPQRQPSVLGCSQTPPSKQQQSPWQQQNHKAPKKGPVLPPRPNPGHRLYNKYTLELPHGIGAFDYNGTNTGELSFQKNEVLVLLEELDSRTYDCQVGNAKGTVKKTHMKIITPLGARFPGHTAPENNSFGSTVENKESLQVQALYDFTAEGPGELPLQAGDMVTHVEQLDSEWYMGTCRNITGYFPINYVQILNKTDTSATGNTWKSKASPEPVRGPRCVARFDFEAEQSDELSFFEGDVIQLKEYVGGEWARGEISGHGGIFPLNFVDVVEDLPKASLQKSGPDKIALSGMAGSSTQTFYKSNKADCNGEEWAVALYDFTAETEEDLTFQQGDRILVTAHIDEEWWSGRVNGTEGVFPKAFVETLPGGGKW